jgi:hypothetical protein
MEWVETEKTGAWPGGVTLRVDGYEFPATVTAPFDQKAEAELDPDSLVRSSSCSFYFYWLRQPRSDPDAALRDAQREPAKDPDTTWTSFVMIGE